MTATSEDFRGQLRGAFDTLLDDVEVRGTGVVSVPGCPVPPVQAGDMQRDAAEDYAEAVDCPEEPLGELAAAWIRRAAHAEVFARALEAELEKVRCG